MINRFGSWVKVHKEARLDVILDIARISDSELIEDIKNVADKLNKTTLTRKEYNEFGDYSRDTAIRIFGSWKNALEKAGLDKTKKGVIYSNNISDNEMLENLRIVWEKLGRQPRCADFEKGISKFSYHQYCQHFDGLNGTLLRFHEWLNAEDDDVSDIVSEQNVEVETTVENSQLSFDFIPIMQTIETIKSTDIETLERDTEKKEVTSEKPIKTPRINIFAKVRFKVLQKDGFKCVACGRASKEIQLHIDHIIPLAKEGQNVFENYQTLCRDCNLGKSDDIYD